MFALIGCSSASPADEGQLTANPPRGDVMSTAGAAAATGTTGGAGEDLSTAVGDGVFPVNLDAASTPTQGDVPKGGPCASAELNLTRVVPTVWLLLDGSGSMSAPFGDLGGLDRWTTLREALLEPQQGLVARLQDRIAFGLMVYDGGTSLPGIYDPAICPRLIEVAPALDNLDTMAAAYPPLPTGASTPTHYALGEMEQRVASSGENAAPTYVVLATDGMPNLCDFHDGLPSTPLTEEEALQSVRAMAQRGTQLYAISLAGPDPILQAHLEAVAEAGGTGQGAFTPADPSALSTVLSTVLGGTLSCEVQLSGTVRAGRECQGDVTFNNEPLACNDGNGFALRAGGSVLELQGTACEALRAAPSAALRAIFPCEELVLE